MENIKCGCGSVVHMSDMFDGEPSVVNLSISNYNSPKLHVEDDCGNFHRKVTRETARL